MKSRFFKSILMVCILACCLILVGCGCGKKKKTDPASEQVLKISITPTPETVDSAAVTTNGDVTMVNIYAAENPGATTATDDTAGSGNADNSNSTDDSEDMSESDSSDEYDNSEDSYDSENQEDDGEEY